MMTTNEKPYIEDDNLSVAWGRALEYALCGKRERAPLVVTITGFDKGIPSEDPGIRTALDAVVTGLGGWSVETVANTIFPINMWNPSKPAAELYSRYQRAYPKLRTMRETRRGTYFGRMIAHDREPTNQLDKVLRSYRGPKDRRSKLQVAIFHPELDHTDAAYQAFPCMQHVAFTPLAERGLGITGFYTLQYLVQRAYGNYLGLCRLGTFVAHELGRDLKQVTCIASIATVEGKIRKDKQVTTAALRPIREAIAAAMTNRKGGKKT